MRSKSRWGDRPSTLLEATRMVDDSLDCRFFSSFKKWIWGQVCYHMPLILALGRQRQSGVCEFKTSLLYKVSPGQLAKITLRNLLTSRRKKKKKALEYGATDEAQVAGYWPSTHTAQGLIPALHKSEHGETLRTRPKISTLKMDPGGSKVQGHEILSQKKQETNKPCCCQCSAVVGDAQPGQG